MQALRSRSFFFAVMAFGYVSFAALQSRDGATGPAWIVLSALLVGLGLCWIKSTPPMRGVDPIEPTVRSASRATASGVSLLVASWMGEAGTASLSTASSIGSAMAAVGALVSLARIAEGVGMLKAPPSTRRFDATALAAMLWGIAIVLPLSRMLVPDSTTTLDPLAIDYASLVASSGGLGLLIAASFRVRALRRLELGVADRAAAAFSLSVATLAVAVPAALLRVAPSDRVMAAATVCASAWVQFSCISHEPNSVAKTMRTVLGIVLLGAPVGLAGVALGLRAPQSAGLLTLAVGGASVVVGLVAPALARPLGPARSRWIEAIQRANEAALHPDPDTALREALSAVRSMLPGQTASPAIYQFSPPQVLTMDRAGYLHTQPRETPSSLHTIAEGEPERAVRMEVLRAVEVRRPDVRPLVEWMDARGLLSVTLVRDDDGPVGLLGIPRGKRRAPMNIEEVRAVRVLADRIGAVLGVSSALARSRQRELALQRLAEERADALERLQFHVMSDGGRAKAGVQRLAHALRAKTYSPAAAMAVEEARRRGRLGVPVTLLAPPGVNPVPWAAEAHLESARSTRPLVVVYGTYAPEHDLQAWRDANTSPLTLADGGTLMIVDVACLPRAVQDYIAASLAERVAPSGSAVSLDVALAVSVPHPVSALVATGRISEVLADWLGERELPIPGLASRSEDLRAMVLDHLAHHGMQYRGAPLGVDDRALMRLMEHSWPGNDNELDDVLLRATLVAKGKRITSEDLDEIGFAQRAAL